MASGLSKGFKKDVLKTPNHDHIALVVRNDALKTKFGIMLYEAYGHIKHRHQYISSKLRELARLLINLRKKKSKIRELSTRVRNCRV